MRRRGFVARLLRVRLSVYAVVLVRALEARRTRGFRRPRWRSLFGDTGIIGGIRFQLTIPSLYDLRRRAINGKPGEPGVSLDLLGVPQVRRQLQRRIDEQAGAEVVHAEARKVADPRHPAVGQEEGVHLGAPPVEGQAGAGDDLAPLDRGAAVGQCPGVLGDGPDLGVREVRLVHGGDEGGRDGGALDLDGRRHAQDALVERHLVLAEGPRGLLLGLREVGLGLGQQLLPALSQVLDGRGLGMAIVAAHRGRPFERCLIVGCWEEETDWSDWLVNASGDGWEKRWS